MISDPPRLPVETFVATNVLTSACCYVSSIQMAQKRQPKPATRKLIAQLPPLDELLRGSLLERHTFHPARVFCSTCASGKGHHQWVLNVNYPGGNNRQVTLHPDQVAQVRGQIANLDRVREILERICETNQQQLRRQRDLLRSRHD